jgi:hypothetical protein
MFKLHYTKGTMRYSQILYAAFIFSILILFSFNQVHAQTSNSIQFWPELDLTSKPFNKSTIGLDFYTNRESYSNNANMFGYQSTIGGKIWYNHYFKAKVKTSFFFEPIYNKAEPESGNSNRMEYRLAVQNVYYSPFKRWTLQNRIRLEERFIENSSGNYEHVLRPRYFIKGILGINKKVLIQGTIYCLASNEIMFNTGSSSTGYHIIDRDVFQFGLGYCITDYITIESLYAYSVRVLSNGETSSIQAWSLTLSISNILSPDYFKGYFHKK